MALSDIQTSFLTILNRRDCTPTQVLGFIALGTLRIQRELRVPDMENLTAYTFTGSETPVGTLAVPADYLEIISLAVDDAVAQRKLVRVDLTTATQLAQNQGEPEVFYRQGDYFILGPSPMAGQVVYLSYYQKPTALVNPTDTNSLTTDTPDLLVYAALTYAADTFLDERGDKWEGRYTQILQSVQEQADQDELENASITTAYNTEFDPYYPFC